MVFEADREDDRLTLRREGTRWLSNCFEGGYREADAAHNLTVQEGFDRTDLAAYAAERLGDRPAGPTLLTGVSQRHARCARLGPVEAVATAGLSNPASLPVPASADADVQSSPHETEGCEGSQGNPGSRPGTVNVFVGTTRALEDGALAGLLATAVEAKAATLLAAADVPGTTSDAVAVGCDPSGDPARFAGRLLLPRRGRRARQPGTGRRPGEPPLPIRRRRRPTVCRDGAVRRGDRRVGPRLRAVARAGLGWSATPVVRPRPMAT